MEKRYCNVIRYKSANIKIKTLIIEFCKKMKEEIKYPKRTFI